MNQQPTPGEIVAKVEGGGIILGTWIDEPHYQGFGVVVARIPSRSASAQADADLIATCCNAAKQVNPANPLAAAWALPELLAALKSILARERGYDNGMCSFCYTYAFRSGGAQSDPHEADCPYAMARAAIAAATEEKES